MYFNFEDYRPDTPTLPRSLTRLEVCLLTVVFYLSLVILLLVWPTLPFVQRWEIERQQEIAKQQEIERERQRDQARFVFMAPRADRKPVTPPERAELSDQDAKAQTVERAEKPTNSLPFSRGNTFEHTDSTPPPDQKTVETPQPETQQASSDQRQGLTLPEAQNGQQPRAVETPQPRGPSMGVLAEAIRNVQKYAPRDSYVNLQGGADQNFSPDVQFDTKGVEFGPWLRRFLARLRRNWIPMIPNAAMVLKGHTSISFYVDKTSGRITELSVVRPSTVDAFNNAAYNALVVTSPTDPLPPEYPDDRAFITITFYYNENPYR